MIEEQLQFQKAIACLEEGNLSDAEVHLQQVLSRNAIHTGAMVSYIQCLERQNRRNESLPLMAVLHSIHPDNIRFTTAYVEALRDAGRYEEALFPLRTCLQKIQPNADLVALLSQTYSEIGDTLNANAFARWALVLDPCHQGALSTLVGLLSAEQSYEQAIELLKAVVKSNPNAYRDRLKLGDLYDKNGQKELAVQQFAIVKRQEPLNSDLWGLIGKLLIDLRRYPEAELHLKESIRMKPENGKAIYHLGNLKSELGQFEQALKLYEQALQFELDFARAHYNCSLCLMSLGRFAQGFSEYHWRWQSSGSSTNDVVPLPLPTWDGVFLQDMHLLVWTEQGLGDGIFFVRILPVLQYLARRAGFKVQLTFASDPRLRAVFRNSFPDCEIVSYHETTLMRLLRAPKAPQFQIAVGDLFCMLWQAQKFDGLIQACESAQERELPFFQKYLCVDEKVKQDIIQRHVSQFEAQLDRKPQYRIGLSWHSIGERCGGERSLPLDIFLPMMKAHPEIQWVSLQYGDHQKEIKKLRNKLPKNCQFFVDDTIDSWHDIDDFMTLIAGLDLVISIDNSTIHMSGALGVPTWLLLGPVHNWRWPQEGDNALWYPHMEIKRWGVQKAKDLAQVWEKQLNALFRTSDSVLK